jgi:hypothetical protein
LLALTQEFIDAHIDADITRNRLKPTRGASGCRPARISHVAGIDELAYSHNPGFKRFIEATDPAFKAHAMLLQAVSIYQYPGTDLPVSVIAYAGRH